MSIPIKATEIWANVNMVHSQGIGVCLRHFPKFPIVYPVGPVYYCTRHPYNTILGDLKFYVGFQKITSKPLEHCEFFTLKVILGDHPTGQKNRLSSNLNC